jgi:nucleotide-binding universal stress UspA family protein
MFEHALVAVDLTPAGDLLVGCAPELQALGTKRLTLVHVASVDYPIAGAVAHLDEYRELLEAQAEDLRGRGFAVTVDVRPGNPAREIIRATHQAGASLILLGSRSRSRAHAVFIGSVALEVLAESTLPVLFLRIEPRTGTEGAPLVPFCCPMDGPVIVATDFSPSAERAVSLAAALAKGGAGRHLTLLHADGREGEDRLAALAAKLRADGVSDIEAKLLEGEPKTVILETLSERGDALLVMGTRGAGLIGRLTLGSVSRGVLGKVRIPVLLVPEDAP